MTILQGYLYSDVAKAGTVTIAYPSGFSPDSFDKAGAKACLLSVNSSMPDGSYSLAWGGSSVVVTNLSGTWEGGVSLFISVPDVVNGQGEIVRATTDLTGGSSFSSANSTLKLPPGETDLSKGAIGGSASLLTQKRTLAVLGDSIPTMGYAMPQARIPGTAVIYPYSWANGIVTMVTPGHGIPTGTECTGDVHWDGGAAWSAFDVTVTATSATDLTYPLANDPGPAWSGYLYILLKPGKVSIASISYSGTTLTVVLGVGLQLNNFAPGAFRLSFEGCTGAAADTLNAAIAVAPIAATASGTFTMYLATDPGALTGGFVRFAPSRQANQYSFVHALLQALGHPFTLSHQLSCGATRAAAQKGSAAYLAGLPAEDRPGFALIEGGVNSLANGVTTTCEENIAVADTLAAAGIVPILIDGFLATGLTTYGALYAKYQRDIRATAKAKGYLLLEGGAITLKYGATTPVPAEYTDVTNPPITSPTLDGTHLQKYGAHWISRAMAASRAGQQLQTIARELPDTIGGQADNLAPNPMFKTRTGGTVNSPGIGVVPSGWQTDSYVTGPTPRFITINRAEPTKWVKIASYDIGDVVTGRSYAPDFAYVAIVAGVVGANEPAFPEYFGGAVVDGGVTWLAINRAACDGKSGCWSQVTLDPIPAAITLFDPATKLLTFAAATGSKRGIISGVLGSTRLNNRFWCLSSSTLTTATLQRDETQATAAETFGAYVSGGVFIPCGGINWRTSPTLPKSGKWVTGDMLSFAVEYQTDDVAYCRTAAVSAAFSGVTTAGEATASAYSSQIILPKSGILSTQPFLAPREISAAAQTVELTAAFEFVSGTVRIARPTLVNHSA